MTSMKPAPLLPNDEPEGMIDTFLEPVRPNSEAESEAEIENDHLDFVIFYAGTDYASISRVQGKLKFLHPACKKFITVGNPHLSLNETVDQIAEHIAGAQTELDMAKLARQLKQGERLHGGHGNRGPMGVLMDFIRTNMRLRSEGPAWKLYVDVKFPEVMTLLRERGYDPLPISAAWTRTRKRVYPWWLHLLPQK